MKFFIFIMILVSSIGHASDFDHLRSNKYWTTTPSVYVCNNTAIDTQVVKQAVDFWIDQGFKINPHVNHKDCNNPIKIGQIVIEYFAPGKNPSYYNALANSYNFKNNSNHRAYSKIYVRKSLEKEVDIYKHEIGHSLGLEDDYSNYDSVMTHEKIY